MQTVAIFSKKILAIPYLNHFFTDINFVSKQHHRDADAYSGWGLRPTTCKARKFAQRYNKPFISLEDGFLRSIGLGLTNYPPLSLIADDIGIYYDASLPSRLEQLIHDKPLLHKQDKVAEQALQLILHNQLTKYNQSADFKGFNTVERAEKVLVIDQTAGDLSVKYGGATQHTFTEMLNAAIIENPNADIYIKTHPNVINGYKNGYLTQPLNQQNVSIICEDVNSFSLLTHVDKVYTVTSHMGFEALLLGKRVITFGLPWYAGWCVSDDRHEGIALLKQQKRRLSASVFELFIASYLIYPRYLNPFNHQPGDIFNVIDYLTQIKVLNNKLRGEVAVVGMSFWKRQVLKPFINVPSAKVKFYTKNKMKRLLKKGRNNHQQYIIWGQGKKELLQLFNERKIIPLRMEDGFIRSVGLGSNFVMPCSLVLDQIGIYFNATQVSELENILLNKSFTDSQRTKAQVLQQLIIKTKITKYNVGLEQKFISPDCASKIILIPGQVEDDASIIYGSPVIKTNLDLIKTVRKHNPTAHIIYKPHPDVLSGNRRGDIVREQLEAYVDETIDNVNIINCIEHVDEIHTMTSLAGFEALLRNKRVVCYGQPFYSGWGLTTDIYPTTRRNRHLLITELIYGVLYDYPIYIHPKTYQFTNPETLLLELRQLSNNQLKTNWIKKQFIKLIQFVKIRLG